MADQGKPALMTRIELVEKELKELRKKLASTRKPGAVSLRGIWKDIDVTEEDIEEAKRSLFRNIDDI